VFGSLDRSKYIARSTALGGFKLVWGAFIVNWKMTLSGRLQFEFGSIDCGFGELSPPDHTSVERVSHISFIIWTSGIDVFSSHQQSNVQTCETVLITILKLCLYWWLQMYFRAIYF